MKLKNLIASLLTINPIGWVIKKYFKNNIPFYHTLINVDNKYINKTIVAQIFWKIYESAEIRFINKYLERDKDSIEIGSSIGVVSSIIGKHKFPNSKLYCFEANEFLIDTIKSNLTQNGVQNFEIKNFAIGPIAENFVSFQLGKSNLSSKISTGVDSLKIPTIDLQKFITTFSISEFNLICDIEGAEIYIIFEQTELLNSCSTAIIELHDTQYNGINYTINELNSFIINKSSLKIVDNYGAVYVYKN